MEDNNRVLDTIRRLLETNQQYGKRHMRPLTLYNQFLSIALKTMPMTDAINLYRTLKTNPKRLEAILNSGYIEV